MPVCQMLLRAWIWRAEVNRGIVPQEQSMCLFVTVGFGSGGGCDGGVCVCLYVCVTRCSTSLIVLSVVPKTKPLRGREGKICNTLKRDTV